MKADLHIHSEYSFDALNSVNDIIKQAISIGLDVIAISDHNETLGSLKAQKYTDIEVISAIEIDCFFNNEIIHILGYGVDLTNIKYEQIKKHYIEELNRIAYKRIQIINDYYKCDLDINAIKNITRKNRPMTNVEITQILFQKVKDQRLEIYKSGAKSDGPLEKFYWDNLSLGKWGYVKMNLPAHHDIIKLIHDSGGIVICAHPKATIKNNLTLINQLIKDGVDGFEAYSNYHDENDRKLYIDICKKNDLLVTMGSDFHGITKPNIRLGNYGCDLDCTDLVDSLKSKIILKRKGSEM